MKSDGEIGSIRRGISDSWNVLRAILGNLVSQPKKALAIGSFGHALWMAGTAYRRERYEKAIKHFDRCISLIPAIGAPYRETWFAHEKKIECLQKLGRRDEADQVRRDYESESQRRC